MIDMESVLTTATCGGLKPVRWLTDAISYVALLRHTLVLGVMRGGL